VKGFRFIPQRAFSRTAFWCLEVL